MKLPTRNKNASDVKALPNQTTTANEAGSRYRNLILSIMIFLGLIGALLAYTFYTSRVLQQNTGLVNVSNQVANDAQSVIKDLFDMQNSYGEDITSPHMATVLKRLKENSEAIDRNISAMAVGGTTTDKDGHTISLPVLKDPETLKALQDTKAQWEQLKPKVADYLKVAGDINADAATPLSVAGEQAKTSSLAMNDSLRTLTDNTFARAEAQANTIRYIQILGVATILGYFAIFIFFFMRRLRESDAQALIAQKETQDIMSNVNTGLFLLDKDLVIGNQYSTQLTNIIGTDNIAGQNLTSLLKNKVSEKDLETTQGFVKQLYNPRVKEKLINDLNPLKKVMVQDEKNRGHNRFLDFKFSRVSQNNQIEKILVNVQDITPQVRLEQRLEHERAQNDLQVEMLTTILNVSPAIISEFIRNTKENIVKINNVLKSPGSNQSELEDKLTRMYRIMHSIKGEASSLSLHSFTTIASNFEEKLKGLQSQGKLAGNDFLPLTIHLDELLNLSNTIEALGKRINQNTPNINSVASLNATTSPPVATPANPNLLVSVPPANNDIVLPIDTQPSDSVAVTSPIAQPQAMATPTAHAGRNEFYQQFANSIAARQHKQVQLQVTGFDEVTLPSSLESGVKEIVIQLIRNAVVHGIETPEQRTTQGKPSHGNISLSLLELADSYQLTIEDDGRGIDYEAVRQRAVEMGYSASEVALWTKQKLNALLFKSGFSTKQDTDEDAGRGVGMDIIKEGVKDLQGQLGLETKEGVFTRFAIKLPKTV